MRDRIVLGVVSAIGLALLSAQASASTVFGSKLNHEPTPAETCKQNHPADMCTWVLSEGQQNVGHERAPKNGTIVKLRIRSCSAGSFILQLARVAPVQKMAKVVTTGPEINYHGDPRNCNGSTIIETFNVNVPVLAGEYLAVIATRVGFIYNSSGDGSLEFDPPLPDGGGYQHAFTVGNGSGFLLLQAQYND